MIEKRIGEKIVGSFLDIIIMSILHGKPAYGYELISVVHNAFGVLLSPGSLYPLLHVLEEKGLLESDKTDGRIFYKTSPKGEQQYKTTSDAFNTAIEHMLRFIKEKPSKQEVFENIHLLQGRDESEQ